MSERVTRSFTITFTFRLLGNFTRSFSRRPLFSSSFHFWSLCILIYLRLLSSLWKLNSDFIQLLIGDFFLLIHDRCINSDLVTLFKLDAVLQVSIRPLSHPFQNLTKLTTLQRCSNKYLHYDTVHYVPRRFQTRGKQLNNWWKLRNDLYTYFAQIG